MRKIIVLEFLTLDGVMQAPGGSEEDKAEGFKYGGWMGPYFEGEVGGKEMEKQMKKTSALLLGRKTYDIWVKFWPTHTETWPQVNKITKYVVSTTLKNPTWENTVVIDNIEELKKTKDIRRPGHAGIRERESCSNVDGERSCRRVLAQNISYYLRERKAVI
jgi:dihydrofolate reductase